MDGDADLSSALLSSAFDDPIGVTERLLGGTSTVAIGTEGNVEGEGKPDGSDLDPAVIESEIEAGEASESSRGLSVRKATELKRMKREEEALLRSVVVSPALQARSSIGRSKFDPAHAVFTTTMDSEERRRLPSSSWADEMIELGKDTPRGTEHTPEEEGPVENESESAADSDIENKERHRLARKRRSLGLTLPINVHQRGTSDERGKTVARRPETPEENIGKTIHRLEAAMSEVMRRMGELEDIVTSDRREHAETIDILKARMEGFYSSPPGSEVGKRVMMSKNQSSLHASRTGVTPPQSTPAQLKAVEGPAPSKTLVVDVVRRFMGKHVSSSARAVRASLPSLIADVQACYDVTLYPHHGRVASLVQSHLKTVDVVAVMAGMSG